MSEIKNVNVNSNKSEVVPELASIEVVPQPFNAQTEGMITTTSGMTDLISQLFGGVFNDYSGCNVYVYGGAGSRPAIPQSLAPMMIPGNLYVDIYFEKSNGVTGGIDNLLLISKSDDKFANLVRNCGGGPSRAYDLNQDTKDSLIPLIPGWYKENKNFNPMWIDRIVEEYANTNTFNNQMKSVLRVIGLDVDAIMGKIYGIYDKDEYADYKERINKINSDTELSIKEKIDTIKAIPEPAIRFDHHCMPIIRSNRGLYNMYYNQNMGFTPNNNTNAFNIEYVIQVLRNDRNIINAMREAIGLVPMASATDYVRYNR